MEEVIWRADVYEFSAPHRLADRMEEKKETEQAIHQIKSNPDFATVLEEQQRAKKYFDEIMEHSRRNSSEADVCRERISEGEKQLKQLAGEIYLLQ